MAEILQCAFCGGTGVQPRSLASKCIACRGKGEVKLKDPVIQCPACKGSGRAANSSALSCLHCKGVGVVEKTEIEKGSADIIQERLGEITKRLDWVQKEAAEKETEIEKKLKPIEPFAKEVKRKVKKEVVWIKELGDKLKKAWESLWKD